MFCSKCGTKAIDGAVFCPKCGAKLIQDNSKEREPVPLPEQESGEMPIPTVKITPESVQKLIKEEEPLFKGESVPAHSSESVKTASVLTEQDVKTEQEADVRGKPSSIAGNEADIHAFLKENIDKCPAIKSAKQVKKGVRLHGKIYNYTVRLVTAHNVQARIRPVLVFPFSILYGVLAGLLCVTTGVILQELIEYGSICIEYYHGLLFALCCLATGATVLIHSFMGRKEKNAVGIYVREALEPKQIYLSERKWAGGSTIKAVVAVALTVAAIIVLPLSLPEPIEYPDELLFDGFPAARFLDMTQKDIELEFGEEEPTNKNAITADDYYNYNDGIEHVIYSKETGKVIYIELLGSYCSYNRKNLSRSMERVLDILTKRDWHCVDPRRCAYEVYGSIHSGFYYYDGEYISEYVGADYRWQYELDEIHHYQVFPLHTYGEKDYKIALITVRYEDDDRPLMLHKICLYTDEWIETVNAAAVSLNQIYTNAADSSNTRKVLYEGIPVSQFFVLSADELVEVLGLPVDYNEYTLIYDDIEFWLDNGKITSAESFSLEKFTVNGDTLETRRNELIALLGDPSDEGEGGSGYQLEFSLEDCEIVIAMDEDISWRVWLYPPQY